MEVVKSPLNSAKLETLKGDYSAKWAELGKITEPFSTEAVSLKLEIFRIDKEISGEIANLTKQANEAAAAEKRNERLKLMDNYDAAVIAKNHADAEIAKIAVGKRTPEQLAVANEANDAMQAARDIVTNELLARYATSSPAKTAVVGGEKTGTKSAEIKALYIQYTGEGKTSTEAEKLIVAAGYSRGTTGAVCLEYRKSLAVTA